MRQFKLREEKSFVKILKEPPAAKPKVNWSRRVYIAIFLVVAFLFIKRIYNANMIIFANGQIDLPKQTVKFPNDIKLLELNIKEGSQVCQGDTLFVLLSIHILIRKKYSILKWEIWSLSNFLTRRKV